MTSVSQSAGPRPVQARSAAPAHAPEPAPADVRAMKDAVAAARGRMGQAGEQPLLRDGKAAPLKEKPGPLAQGDAPTAGPKQAANGRTPAAAAGRPGEEQAPAPLDRRQDRRDQLEGLALPGQPGSPAALPLPLMPSPQANPAAFAQMLADLWTRENGKGSKEVSVRFGRDAWPATGALLVRNAAGALDVTLYVGDRGRRYGDLSDLKGALGEAGVTVGSLEMEAA